MKLNRSWLTALCLAGMGSVFILPALGISLGTLGSFLLILLCPLSHVLMMRGMRRGHAEEDTGSRSREHVVNPPSKVGILDRGESPGIKE